MQAVLMRAEWCREVFLLILLFLLNSPSPFLPLYGSSLPCTSCLTSALDGLDQVTVLACRAETAWISERMSRPLPQREPCAGEMGFPASDNAQRCLIFVANTESSCKCVQFCGYMNLLSLRIIVGNLLYKCKEL